MSDNGYVMMALGDYRFGIDTATYEDLEQVSSWRWPLVDRIGVAPAAQYVGPGEDTVSMRGSIYPFFRGGLNQIEDMKAVANKGEPLDMVDGTGRVWGRFVITEIRQRHAAFFSNGTPRRIDFDITLLGYGDDQ
jgi:phage protein U